MQVHVTAQSQAHRLRERLEEAAVSHGAALRADLRNVRVMALAGGSDGQVFFCNVEPIRVREVLTAGDGGPIPLNLEVDGLQVPEVGLYNLFNARVSSNGAMRVELDHESRIESAAYLVPIPE